MGWDIQHNGEKDIDFSKFKHKIEVKTFGEVILELNKDHVQWHIGAWNVPNSDGVRGRLKRDNLNDDAIFYSREGEVVAYYDQKNGVIYY